MSMSLALTICVLFISLTQLVNEAQFLISHFFYCLLLLLLLLLLLCFKTVTVALASIYASL